MEVYERNLHNVFIDLISGFMQSFYHPPPTNPDLIVCARYWPQVDTSIDNLSFNKWIP